MKRLASTRLSLAVFCALLCGVAPRSAQAHPHILIDARAHILFDAQGRVTGVTNVWDFDEAFSAYAIQGYDSKGDGNPTREDLQPLAEINAKSLAEYDYFTRLTVGGQKLAFGKPKDYFDVFENEKLRLTFTLPLVTPLDVRGKPFELDVYDPEYFAAITFAAPEPVDLGARQGCSQNIHRPEPLDTAVAAKLSVIPVDQRSLPPELFAVTDKLVNGVTVTCR